MQTVLDAISRIFGADISTEIDFGLKLFLESDDNSTQ
jgi:hypothetical protein